MGVERFDITRHREAALQLGERMHREAGRVGWNAERFLEVLQQPHAYACLYRDAAGQCIGGLVGYVYREAQGLGDLVAQDLGWYVDPEHRGGTAAVRMVRDFEAWAKSKGARCVLLAQTTAINVDRTRQWCEALGYTVIGYVTRRML